MSNGEVCCILGLCCPAGSKRQRMSLIAEIAKARPVLSAEQAAAAAERVLEAHGYFQSIVELIDTLPPS